MDYGRDAARSISPVSFSKLFKKVTSQTPFAIQAMPVIFSIIFSDPGVVDGRYLSYLIFLSCPRKISKKLMLMRVFF